MTIRVFEWLSCGGLWREQFPPDSDNPIQSQGLKMLQAITEDFLDAGLEVLLPVDGRLDHRIIDRSGLKKRLVRESDDLPTILLELAEQADQVMLIAPESDSCLETCLGWIEPMENKLISPDAEFVRIASNKQLTFEYLLTNGFDCIPEGINYGKYLPNPTGFVDPPVVLKPIDGAGSEEVQLITDWLKGNRNISRSPKDYWLEQFISGMPVSVSVLCGPTEHHFLPPTRQIFDREPFGNYVESGHPLDPAIARRATKLANTAIHTMPPTRGYVGIDMVISDSLKQQDCIIEINPRLTMSYLKLREICPENLATLMLADGVRS